MTNNQRIFGIFQDGPNIKVASLLVDKDDIIIERLFKRTLSEVSERESDNLLEDDVFNRFNFGKEEGESNYSFEDEFSAAPKENAPEEEMVQIDVSNIDFIKQISEELEFYNAKLALNLDVSNVNYRFVSVDPKANKKKILLAVKEIFEGDNTESAIYNYFRQEDDQVVGISLQGKMDLLDNLLAASQFPPKRDFIYGSIQTNEIALMNAVRKGYETFEDDVTAIFYIGVDYCRVLLMKGTEFLMALPIINEGSDSEDIIKTVYSRFLFEKSHLEIPMLNRIFLAGESIDLEMIDYLAKNEAEANVELLLPKSLIGIDGDYPEQELCEYIIPLMLGLELASPKDADLFHVNFLPKKLKEQQNDFALGIPGFIAIIFIVATSLLGLNLYFEQLNKNRAIQNSIKEKQNKLEIYQKRLDSLYVMEQKIAELEQNIARVNQLLGNKNQWHYIVEEISTSFSRHAVSWSNRLTKTETGILLNGTTSRRKNIIAFSQIFPSGKIHSITEVEIQGFNVWEFEISFGMPNALDTRRKDHKREGGEEIPITSEKPLSLVNEEAPSPRIETPKSNIKPKKEIPISDSDENEEDQSLEYTEAKILYFDGDYEKAREAFTTYIENNSDSYVVNAKYFVAECNYQLGDIRVAERQFKEVIDIGERKVPDALLMLGIIKQKNDEIDEAKSLFSRLITEYPESPYSSIAKKKLKEMSR